MANSFNYGDAMHDYKKQDLPSLALSILGESVNRPGGFIYSSHETICPGQVYLMGLNPGGAGGEKLADAAVQFVTRTKNAYLDEKWENRTAGYGKGEAPLQRRVDGLLNALGYKTVDTFATNLIFMQSRDETGVTWHDADLCWKVHEVLLGMVRPRLIVVFGNSDFSPYSYLRSKFEGDSLTCPSGHGDWMIKGFHTMINRRNVFIVGLPHLSRYQPLGKPDVFDWIQKNASV